MKIKLFTIPNALTLMNLLCGSFAVVAALAYENLMLAFWLIIAAAVFDFFDGFVARLLHQPSAIGVQLDSLADDISFGFAPSAILFVMFAESPSLFEWSQCATTVGGYALFVVAAFSALRLAKFNIDDTQHTEFCGLPVPANAMFLASLGMLSQMQMLSLPQEEILVIAFIMSYLLISPVRMFALKFKGFGLRGNELRYGFIALCIVLGIVLRLYAVPVIVLSYIVISFVRWAFFSKCSSAEGCDKK